MQVFKNKKNPYNSLPSLFCMKLLARGVLGGICSIDMRDETKEENNSVHKKQGINKDTGR